MNAIIRYWQSFARYVKHGHAKPLLVVQPIPVESWTYRRDDYGRAKKAHRGQRDAYAHLRKSTNEVLLRGVLSDKEERALIELTYTHPNLFRDANTIAFVEAVKAATRQSVSGTRR